MGLVSFGHWRDLFGPPRVVATVILLPQLLSCQKSRRLSRYTLSEKSRSSLIMCTTGPLVDNLNGKLTIIFSEHRVTYTGTFNFSQTFIILAYTANKQNNFSQDISVIPFANFVTYFSNKWITLLRTPVGTGALQCTTCYSYLGVYCSEFEDVDLIRTRLSTLHTLLCTQIAHLLPGGRLRTEGTSKLVTRTI